MSIASGCKEPGPIQGGNSTTTDNVFVYEGESIDIASVVKFDQDNNTVQFWLSPQEGLTTVDQVEEYEGHVVLSVHKSYIGNRDRFTKTGSFIRFGSMEYKTGDAGMGYIDVAIQNDSISLKFAVEGMQSKSEEGSEAVLHGEYKGPFSTFTEAPYENQWSVNRKRHDISEAGFILREDGKADTYILMEEDGKVALEFTMPQNKRGVEVLFNTTDAPNEEIFMKYDDGKEINVAESFGSVTADVDAESMKISYDITFEGERIKAEYEGGYTPSIKKANRYEYYSGYPYATNYDGRFLIEGLRVERVDWGSIKFIFLPNGTDGTYSDIPELTISDFSLIGQENIDLRNTEGWYFEFDKLAVSSYENEWKPAPSEGSTLTILENEDGDFFIIDLVMEVIEPTFKYVSTIDLHYEGPITNKENMDE